MNGNYLLPDAEFYVAINNKGLWPNLKVLPNQEIVAAIYNHPSHGFGCGNVELWVTEDQGRSWSFRSLISDHSEHSEWTRVNHAMGLNSKGELIALVSGKDEKPSTLPVQLCISADNGCTWHHDIIDENLVPYGNIILNEDGSLVCSMYGRDESGIWEAYLYRSIENGVKWEKVGKITDAHGEVALLTLNDGEYLAAARHITNIREEIGRTGAVRMFTSQNNGTKWEKGLQISLPMQHPANLLRLHNDNILLTYGTRIGGLYGVIMRISKDDGKTWSLPRPLITIPERSDCGYPSSVQFEDGTIVTAYYFGPKMTPVCLVNGVPWNKNYHMGVARWQFADGMFQDHEVEETIEY